MLVVEVLTAKATDRRERGPRTEGAWFALAYPRA